MNVTQCKGESSGLLIYFVLSLGFLNYYFYFSS